ncbi:hypothetical protein FISHEDRAFT_76473 [Fistulina hepatica ATCC 64428]|uniref:Uncharacterized protein n=1 Tax=Fistulina hepatica ATCC 64428 TaxID=1128425 RepID=A0A0D7A5H0_9AGAR|nr:hypothetical protein FISHEDRAFT_76473 [Fistulina hepatica ATCC 64428]
MSTPAEEPNIPELAVPVLNTSSVVDAPTKDAVSFTNGNTVHDAIDDMPAVSGIEASNVDACTLKIVLPIHESSVSEHQVTVVDAIPIEEHVAVVEEAAEPWSAETRAESTDVSQGYSSRYSSYLKYVAIKFSHASDIPEPVEKPVLDVEGKDGDVLFVPVSGVELLAEPAAVSPVTDVIATDSEHAFEAVEVVPKLQGFAIEAEASHTPEQEVVTSMEAVATDYVAAETNAEDEPLPVRIGVPADTNEEPAKKAHSATQPEAPIEGLPISETLPAVDVDKTSDIASAIQESVPVHVDPVSAVGAVLEEVAPVVEEAVPEAKLEEVLIEEAVEQDAVPQVKETIPDSAISVGDVYVTQEAAVAEPVSVPESEEVQVQKESARVDELELAVEAAPLAGESITEVSAIDVVPPTPDETRDVELVDVVPVSSPPEDIPASSPVALTTSLSEDIRIPTSEPIAPVSASVAEAITAPIAAENVTARVDEHVSLEEAISTLVSAEESASMSEVETPISEVDAPIPAEEAPIVDEKAPMSDDETPPAHEAIVDEELPAVETAALVPPETIETAEDLLAATVADASVEGTEEVPIVEAASEAEPAVVPEPVIEDEAAAELIVDAEVAPELETEVKTVSEIVDGAEGDDEHVVEAVSEPLVEAFDETLAQPDADSNVLRSADEFVPKAATGEPVAADPVSEPFKAEAAAESAVEAIPGFEMVTEPAVELETVVEAGSTDPVVEAASEPAMIVDASPEPAMKVVEALPESDAELDHELAVERPVAEAAREEIAEFTEGVIAEDAEPVEVVSEVVTEANEVVEDSVEEPAVEPVQETIQGIVAEESLYAGPADAIEEPNIEEPVVTEVVTEDDGAILEAQEVPIVDAAPAVVAVEDVDEISVKVAPFTTEVTIASEAAAEEAVEVPVEAIVPVPAAVDTAAVETTIEASFEVIEVATSASDGAPVVETVAPEVAFAESAPISDEVENADPSLAKEEIEGIEDVVVEAASEDVEPPAPLVVEESTVQDVTAPEEGPIYQPLTLSSRPVTPSSLTTQDGAAFADQGGDRDDEEAEAVVAPSPNVIAAPSFADPIERFVAPSFSVTTLNDGTEKEGDNEVSVEQPGAEIVSEVPVAYAAAVDVEIPAERAVTPSFNVITQGGVEREDETELHEPFEEEVSVFAEELVPVVLTADDTEIVPVEAPIPQNDAAFADQGDDQNGEEAEAVVAPSPLVIAAPFSAEPIERFVTPSCSVTTQSDGAEEEGDNEVSVEHPSAEIVSEVPVAAVDVEAPAERAVTPSFAVTTQGGVEHQDEDATELHEPSEEVSVSADELAPVELTVDNKEVAPIEAPVPPVLEASTEMPSAADAGVERTPTPVLPVAQEVEEVSDFTPVPIERLSTPSSFSISMQGGEEHIETAADEVVSDDEPAGSLINEAVALPSRSPSPVGRPVTPSFSVSTQGGHADEAVPGQQEEFAAEELTGSLIGESVAVPPRPASPLERPVTPTLSVDMQGGGAVKEPTADEVTVEELSGSLITDDTPDVATISPFERSVTPSFSVDMQGGAFAKPVDVDEVVEDVVQDKAPVTESEPVVEVVETTKAEAPVVEEPQLEVLAAVASPAIRGRAPSRPVSPPFLVSTQGGGLPVGSAEVEPEEAAEEAIEPVNQVPSISADRSVTPSFSVSTLGGSVIPAEPEKSEGASDGVVAVEPVPTDALEQPVAPSFLVSTQGGVPSVEVPLAEEQSLETATPAPDATAPTASSPIPSRPVTPSFSVSTLGGASMVEVPEPEENLEPAPASAVAPTVGSPVRSRPVTPSFSVSTQGGVTLAIEKPEVEEDIVDSIPVPEVVEVPVSVSERPVTPPSFSVSTQGGGAVDVEESDEIEQSVEERASATEVIEPVVTAAERPITPLSFFVSTQGGAPAIEKAEEFEESAPVVEVVEPVVVVSERAVTSSSFSVSTQGGAPVDEEPEAAEEFKEEILGVAVPKVSAPIALAALPAPFLVTMQSGTVESRELVEEANEVADGAAAMSPEVPGRLPTPVPFSVTTQEGVAIAVEHRDTVDAVEAITSTEPQPADNSYTPGYTVTQQGSSPTTEERQVFPVISTDGTSEFVPVLYRVPSLNNWWLLHRYASSEPSVEGRALNVDIPASRRHRHESSKSTKSARFKDGVWTTISPTVPDQTRTSTEIAQGVFATSSALAGSGKEEVKDDPATAVHLQIPEQEEEEVAGSDGDSDDDGSDSDSTSSEEDVARRRCSFDSRTAHKRIARPGSAIPAKFAKFGFFLHLC